MIGKVNLWILSKQHVEQNIRSSLLLLEILQFSSTVTRDELGCPNLLCHNVKRVDKDELHCANEVVKKGECLLQEY